MPVIFIFMLYLYKFFIFFYGVQHFIFLSIFDVLKLFNIETSLDLDLIEPKQYSSRTYSLNSLIKRC